MEKILKRNLLNFVKTFFTKNIIFFIYFQPTLPMRNPISTAQGEQKENQKFITNLKKGLYTLNKNMYFF